MRRRSKTSSLCQVGLVAALWLAGSFAPAQPPCPPPPPYPYCPPGPYTTEAAPSRPAPYTPGPGVSPSPGVSPGVGPGVGGTTEGGMGLGAGTGAGPEGTGTGTGAASFAGLTAGAGVGATAALDAGAAGYIDSAVPKTMVRLRYDAGFDLNRPDRAEFFYGAWKELSFHPHGINGNGAFFDPKARGPEQLPANLDYQELSSYLEIAFDHRASAFVEVPVRWLRATGQNHWRRVG